MSSEAEERRDTRSAARMLLRRWLSSDDDAVRSAVQELGRQAIAAASRAAERLDRGALVASSASAVLHELRLLAETYGTPPAPRESSWFSRGRTPERATSPDLNLLVASLERERDNVARALIGLSSDRTKLADAEQGLEDAVALIRACQSAVEAAAREIALDQPTRAAFLRETVAAQLLAREQDVLTQLAVTRHGVLALQLLVDGHGALAEAIDRARENSVAALRTAIAARRAVESNRDLLDHAKSLNATVDAAHSGSGQHQDVDRAIADAVMQLRRAIDAAQISAPSL